MDGHTPNPGNRGPLPPRRSNLPLAKSVRRPLPKVHGPTYRSLHDYACCAILHAFMSANRVQGGARERAGSLEHAFVVTKRTTPLFRDCGFEFFRLSYHDELQIVLQRGIFEIIAFHRIDTSMGNPLASIVNLKESTKSIICRCYVSDNFRNELSQESRFEIV
ncbi:hypothetical protein VNO77_27086 [Canavalia gladiata]|uniref:Uncharacterized protein n=1 Tax=Canavalia gladiata TaxID=3824 RepID=A0AAN9KU17_CANGL